MESRQIFNYQSVPVDSKSLPLEISSPTDEQNGRAVILQKRRSTVIISSVLLILCLFLVLSVAIISSQPSSSDSVLGNKLCVQIFL